MRGSTTVQSESRMRSSMEWELERSDGNSLAQFGPLWDVRNEDDGLGDEACMTRGKSGRDASTAMSATQNEERKMLLRRSGSNLAAECHPWTGEEDRAGENRR